MQTVVRDHSPPDGALSEHRPGARPGAGAVATRAGSLLYGRYRLCERLGAGGFGVVWRAEDLQLHREVALKRIPCLHGAHDARTAVIGAADIAGAAGSGSAFNSDSSPAVPGSSTVPGLSTAPVPSTVPGPSATAHGRASREALATARLAHPAIVALYEAFVDEDAVYLVSELVHGDTLANLIAAGTLSDQKLLEIGLALTRALAHAHARGVVHRDVKPHNVLVPHHPGPHGAPAKLTDFGGAQMAGEEALTRTGDTLGTLAYMAPEQSEGREVGPAADLYSLALVLYEGLTGSNPVRGPTPAATARRIGQPLPLLATARGDLPDELTCAIDTALEVDPARRGTLDDLHDALARAGEREHERAGEQSSGTPRSPGPTRTGIGTTRRALGEPAHTVVQPSHEPRESSQVPVESAGPTFQRQEREPTRALLLPRALWLGGALAAMVWLTASGLPGAALLLGAATVAPLLALGPRPPAVWLAAILAPPLGLVGLAGAYPALAGQARRWRTRAMLGALGYWWLILACPLLVSAAGRFPGPRLWLDPAAGLPARAVWERSLTSAATHVVGPALSTGVLLGAILWALAAVVLPWIVRGRGPLLDGLAAIAWSAALLAATPYFDSGLRALSSAARPAEPRGLVVGAILAAAIALAARALRGPVAPAHP